MKTAGMPNAILARMAVEENGALTPRDEDDDEGIGAGFFFKVAGICVAIGIGAMIVFLIFSRAVYAFGFLGGFIAFGAVLCLFAWIYDRRNARA
jgi:high-affinity Fe2+/Pb2+ permease